MTDRATKPTLNMAPLDFPSAVEEIGRRRENGKTYHLKDRDYRTSTRLGAIHYKDDYTTDQWSEIDLTIDANGQMSTAPYNIEIFTDRVGYLYQSKRNGLVEVELVEVGGQPVDNGRFSVRRDNNQLFWDNVAQDIDLKLQLRPLSAEIFKQVKTPTAKRHFKWRVREHKTRPLFRPLTFGTDADKDNLEIQTSVEPLSVSTEFNEYYYDETWTGRVSRIVDRSTRRKEWFDDPRYPVLIDASTSENITANNDDGFEFTAWSTAFNSRWYLGYFTPDEHGGLRFQTLGVPQGATINSSTITMLPEVFNVVGSIQAIVSADDVDDAASWSNGNLPSGITSTAANVTITVTTTGAYTFNVTSLVQEVISRTGWASGNDIRFALINQETAQGDVGVYDYIQGQPNSAQLDVNYTVAGRTPRYGFTNFQTPGVV